MALTAAAEAARAAVMTLAWQLETALLAAIKSLAVLLVALLVAQTPAIQGLALRIILSVGFLEVLAVVAVAQKILLVMLVMVALVAIGEVAVAVAALVKVRVRAAREVLAREE